MGFSPNAGPAGARVGSSKAATEPMAMKESHPAASTAW
eukprot:CAMPEP_0171616238 /NCGR_PEP_ID=MMETSP0990-20121206/13347_1 /TAXON_ID=483369 /ORGANISM="non described non described, Strain CCMP2098" /LENGTH=37 /DNA_ID= /DNA_START= /DNA_END= /DNA_ORIENTATION=